ncbi:hypothetical protein R6Q59_029324 [Mikania micrantha]
MSPSTDLSFTDFLDNMILVNFPPQNPVMCTSGSVNSETEVNDENKKKRMISNRESARRSRIRKQKHLEDTRNQVSRYKTANQQLMNRLRFVNHNGHIVRQENQRLQLESVMLQRKLNHLRRLLIVPELQNTLLPTVCMAMQ